LRLVDDFGGSDDASMAVDNTSAFNCRPVAGTTRWSQHAYGRAIDINPLRNPYVEPGRVSPVEGAAYADRSDVRPGMIVEGGPVVAAFDALGWGWGGRWAGGADYQHFSAAGN
jgi:poly-gamma-glutamate synthesis protein (capsule biosynthesis protein)